MARILRTNDYGWGTSYQMDDYAPLFEMAPLGPSPCPLDPPSWSRKHAQKKVTRKIRGVYANQSNS